MAGVVQARIRANGTLAVSSPLTGTLRAAIGVHGDLAVGLGLGAFDSSGLAVDAAALLDASGTAGTLYADPDRGGSDAPLAGELGLGVGETVISRIRWDGSRLRLNDDDNPAALTLADYFLVPERRVYIQTRAGGVASFAATGHTETAGSNFVTFSNLPADVVAVLDGIAPGMRFVIAVADTATRLAGVVRARIRANGTLAYSSPLTGILRAAIGIRGTLDSSPRLAGVARAAIRARGILRAELPAGAYRTADGDVLDEICWRRYGRADAVPAVLAANPRLADAGPVLPAGVLIALPDLPRASRALPAERLWEVAPPSVVLPERERREVRLGGSFRAAMRAST